MHICIDAFFKFSGINSHLNKKIVFRGFLAFLRTNKKLLLSSQYLYAIANKLFDKTNTFTLYCIIGFLIFSLLALGTRQHHGGNGNVNRGFNKTC